MKSSRIRSLTGVVVLAGVMIAAVGAPAASADDVCSAREVTVSNASVPEGGPEAGNSLYFAVSTTGCSSGSVHYRTVAAPRNVKAAIVGVDYVHTGGVLMWTSNDTSVRKVSVKLVGELLVEYDEWLYLELYSPSVGTILRSPVAMGTIINDDMVMVSPDSEPDCLGAAGRCVQKVKSSAKASYDLLVPFSTSDGTATAGVDYIPVTQGMIIIPAGSQTGTASVAYLQGRVMTGPEYFFINIFDLPPGNGFIPLRATIPMP